MTGRAGGVRAEPIRTAGRWLLAILFLVAGVLHIAHPAPFLGIMPPWVPWPRATVAATGICEIAGAIGLLIPRLRRAAAIGLALYAVCVFPANIQHALNDLRSGTGLGWWYHGPRLALQPAIVWWCLVAGRIPTGRWLKRKA